VYQCWQQQVAAANAQQAGVEIKAVLINTGSLANQNDKIQ